MKRYNFIRNRHIILRKYYKCQWEISIGALKSLKFIITECSCNLSCAVWTEIIENNRIIFFYRSYRRTIFYDHSGKNELIGLLFIIRLLYGTKPAFCGLTFSKNQRLVCLLNTIPPIITVHHIITSHHSGYLSHTDFFHLVHCRLHKIFS